MGGGAFAGVEPGTRVVRLIRRRCLAALSGVLAAPWRAQAQAGKVWHIGVLESQPEAQNRDNFDALRAALGELGYQEGRNLKLSYRSADGVGERFTKLAQELVQLRVDLIVTRGTPSALAAKAATASSTDAARIPVVMAAIGDPLVAVASLSRPGGNLTGLTSLSSDLEAKRVQLLHECVPQARRFAALYNMGNPVFARRWQETEAAARALGVQVLQLDVRHSDGFEAAFSQAKRQQAQALLVGQDGLMQSNRKLIARLAAQHRLPAVYGSVDFIEAGGLFAYGPHYPDMYRRAATYIAKIFKGAKPAELPIEQPTRFELIINLPAARALGLVIPSALRVRADRIVE